jgi:hypothetical protein
VETPDPPEESTAARLGRTAEESGLSAASWAGRGDPARGLSLLALVFAAALFVVLFLPWIGPDSGWAVGVAHDTGLLALAVVLVELLRLRGAWISRGAELVAFCLTAAAGLMGITAWATLRWGVGAVDFEALRYGAWLGFVVALLLLVVAAVRLAVLWRPVP